MNAQDRVLIEQLVKIAEALRALSEILVEMAEELRERLGNEPINGRG